MPTRRSLQNTLVTCEETMPAAEILEARCLAWLIAS